MSYIEKAMHAEERDVTSRLKPDRLGPDRLGVPLFPDGPAGRKLRRACLDHLKILTCTRCLKSSS